VSTSPPIGGVGAEKPIVFRIVVSPSGWFFSDSARVG